jgi:quercetin dioxygenase-like cupin family protein
MNVSNELTCSTADQTETIAYEGRTLCIIVRAEPAPDSTKFYTPTNFNLQVGKIVYPAGSEIPRHKHYPVRPSIACNTSEVLVVQKGRMIVELYNDDYKLLCGREVGVGDVVVLMSGGHGFRLIEDTVLLEVKQGPYGGREEKEIF